MRSPGAGKDPRQIRRMFAGISGTYDLLNHLLSLNVDRSWRRKASRLLDPQPGERILDVCSGTADLALELSRRSGAAAPGGTGHPPDGGGLIIGIDFCPEMLRIGEAKRRRLRAGALRQAGNPVPGTPEVRLGAADALRLPFRSGGFDGASVAFGLRNLPDLDAGLREMFRVLRPRGRAVILEFTRPPSPWFARLFGAYFRRVLPWIGRWISRARDPAAAQAYEYLPASVSEFPAPAALAAAMEAAGFQAVTFQRLTLGIACLHRGEKPEGAAP